MTSLSHVYYHSLASCHLKVMTVLQSFTQTKWGSVSLLLLYSDLKKIFVYFSTTKSALSQYVNIWHTEFTVIQNNHQRSQWPRGLRRRSSTARLLRSWVRIPPGGWMFVCCECCMLSVRGLCDGLITRPEESCRLWRVVVCDQETSKTRRLNLATGLWKIQPQLVVRPRKQQQQNNYQVPVKNAEVLNSVA